jgi:hypothetical protein
MDKCSTPISGKSQKTPELNEADRIPLGHEYRDEN